VSVLGDEDVGGLDVPVNDALRVSHLEGGRELDPELHGLVRGQATLGDTMFERLPLQELHDDERAAFVFADVVDRADSRMIEGRRGSGFSLEALQARLAFRHRLRQKLDSDVTSEACVFGLVDHAHSSSADFLEDLVVRNRRSDHVLVRASFSVASISLVPYLNRVRRPAFS
jgi:hypothetical protein